MGVSTESVSSRPGGFRGGAFRRPLTLRMGDCTISVDSDAGVGSLYSISESRSLFGHEEVLFAKIQAGVLVAHGGQVVHPAVAKLLRPAEPTGGADDVDRAGN